MVTLDDTQKLPRGVLTALVTPVHEGGRIDDAALDRLVERALAGGVAGLSPCGSTGEGPRLTQAQRLHVARLVRDRAGADVAVVPGVQVTAVGAAREELVELGQLGVTAALVAPPAYYPCDDKELVRLYELLADDSPIPLVLYNIPVFTGVPLPAAVVSRLAGHSNIVGIKDSSRDVEYLQSILIATSGGRAARRFFVYTGADTLLVPSLLLGADGTIAPSSNLVPELGVGIVDAFDRGDIASAVRLQSQLSYIVAACRRGPFPAGWKAALSLAGVCEPDPLPPAAPLPESPTQELAKLLSEAEVTPRGIRATSS